MNLKEKRYNIINKQYIDYSADEWVYDLFDFLNQNLFEPLNFKLPKVDIFRNILMADSDHYKNNPLQAGFYKKLEDSFIININEEAAFKKGTLHVCYTLLHEMVHHCENCLFNIDTYNIQHGEVFIDICNKINYKLHLPKTFTPHNWPFTSDPGRALATQNSIRKFVSLLSHIDFNYIISPNLRKQYKLIYD